MESQPGLVWLTPPYSPSPTVLSVPPRSACGLPPRSFASPSAHDLLRPPPLLRQTDLPATGRGHCALCPVGTAPQPRECPVYALELLLRVFTFLLQLLNYYVHVLHGTPAGMIAGMGKNTTA
jgi:hypothetical protein